MLLYNNTFLTCVVVHEVALAPCRAVVVAVSLMDGAGTEAFNKHDSQMSLLLSGNGKCLVNQLINFFHLQVGFVVDLHSKTVDSWRPHFG